MRRRATILLATAVLLVLAAPAYARADKDCKDFTSHDQAQAYFKANGGSAANNVDRLDGDGDGLACEDYAYPAPGPTEQLGSSEPGTSGEKLPFTGPGDTTPMLAAALLGTGVLLLLITRRRPGHLR